MFVSGKKQFHHNYIDTDLKVYGFTFKRSYSDVFIFSFLLNVSVVPVICGLTVVVFILPVDCDVPP